MRHLLFGAAALATVGCTQAPPPGELPPPRPSAGSCDASPAEALVGRQATSETGARILALTGAARLRWGPPDSAFTMDYREDRVNVFYDRTMTITKVTCG